MIIHFCAPAMRETLRNDWKKRWCFACRGRHMFVFMVHDTVEPSYWDPIPSIRCGNCGRVNGDCGFGSEREWE